jgi:hypothetical protein
MTPEIYLYSGEFPGLLKLQANAHLNLLLMRNGAFSFLQEEGLIYSSEFVENNPNLDALLNKIQSEKVSYTFMARSLKKFITKNMNRELDAFKKFNRAIVPLTSLNYEEFDLECRESSCGLVFFSVNMRHMPNDYCFVSHLVLCDGEGENRPITFRDNFLSFNCFKYIDLSLLSISGRVPHSFLRMCKGLVSVVLPDMTNVTEIEKNFLGECDTLTSIDLSSLSNVTEIGDDFLSYCVSLESLDLSGLVNVQKIGYSFVSDCKGLTSIDLSCLVSLTEIMPLFLGSGSCLDFDSSGFQSIIPAIEKGKAMFKEKLNAFL